MTSKSNNIMIKIASNDTEIEQARRLINQVFREKQIVSRKDRDTITFLESKEVLTGNKKYLFVMHEKGSKDLVGAVLATVYPINNELSVIIQYLARKPNVQNQGLGKILLTHVEKYAKKARCKKSYLGVIHHPQEKQEKLVEWYKSQGYRFNAVQQILPKNKAEWFSKEYQTEITAHIYVKPLIPV